MADLREELQSALGLKYSIERELGGGGMARVFLARDQRYYRAVVIKVLRPELAAALSAARFLREIQIAARLTHPHILPLFDSGDDVGVLYYVTPYVPDGSLRRRMEQHGRLSLADTLRVVRGIGGALDYAHRQGYVHRDVKPDNILFADGHPVLADFGIARALSSADMEVITEAGLVLGTPDYMSPEQAAGEQNPSEAGDTYSLACVAYEMLAGEPPLHGSGARATMAKQVTTTPRLLRTIRPEIPIYVERAIARALSKDPYQRFTTVVDFMSALHDEGTATSPKRTVHPAGACVAVLPFVNASENPENEYLSDGITDELIDALTKVSGLYVASRTSVFAFKGRVLDARSIAAALGASWLLEGTVRRSGEKLRITTQLTNAESGHVLWSETFNRTFRDVLTVQAEIAQAIVATLRATFSLALEAPVARRRTASVEAFGFYLKGRYAWNKRTPQGAAEALEYFEKAIAADPNYAQAYSGLADSCALYPDWRGASVPEAFAHGERYARRALELEETLAEAHTSLAHLVLASHADWETARSEFLRAIELDPRYATGHQWYGNYLTYQGRHDEAIAEYHHAAELDPASVVIRRNMGLTYYQARRYREGVLYG